MAENKKPKNHLEQLRTLAESVDFGDLKNELKNSGDADGKAEKHKRGIASVDFGDLKNEINQKPKTK